MNYANGFSKTTLRMKSSLIRELVASTKNIPDLISFAGGFPAPATFPKQMLGELFQEVVEQEGYDVLQYGASEGDTLLKRELLKWDGYELSPQEMLVTVGATNAIYYIGKTLLDPGDVVLCEGPSFLGSLVTFDALQAELHSVPMDAEGIDLNILEAGVKELRAAGKKIKFLYSIPDFQNPAGITMSLRRRRELLGFCLTHQIPIVEDNPYSRLRFRGKDVPTLFRVAHDEYPGSGIVAEIVSFSKILGPGMRMAFVKGNRDLISKMESWQQKINITPDCVSQRVVARFLEKGYMNPHISTICGHYRPYLDKMLSELEARMPDTVTWTKPEGGIFVWLTLPGHLDADELFHQAAQNKVAFIPGSKFYPQGQGQKNTLRLNFTYSTFSQIEEGIKRLAELLG
jgi:2-aminoadipate transaminase